MKGNWKATQCVKGDGRVVAIFVGLVASARLGASCAQAQSEIDPDHFDSPNTEPIPEPKAPANTRIDTIRYEGQFTLPREVRCNGMSLRPGKYSVLLRSNGKVGQATLNHKGHATEIAGIVQTQAAKRRNEVIVENNGKGRALSVIRVTGFDFVFDPQHSVDPSSDSKGAHVEKVLLTVIVPNEIANQVPQLLQRFPAGYLVFGNAICSFNPIYGQGMSVGALQTVELENTLASDVGDLALAKTFFRRAAKVVEIPWTIAVGNDLRIPETVGRRTAGIKLVNWYISKLHKAAHTDPVPALAFHRVGNLLAPPPSLMHPRVAVRVLWENMRPSRNPQPNRSGSLMATPD